MRAFNLRSHEYLATNVLVADTILKRMRGLLGRDIFLPGDALWLKHCNWIHTYGMRFPVDILYVDRNNTVVAVKENIPPNRLTSLVVKAKSAIELPMGTISSTGTAIGDMIAFFL